METVLFTTNPPRRCGVYEFGRATFEALRQSTRYEYVYQEFSEATTVEQFCQIVEQIQPTAVLHNWHPATMPWLTDDVLYELHRRLPRIRHAAVVHDETAPLHWIDAHVFSDPTRRLQEREFKVGRCLWERPEPDFHPGNVIGSFGFGLNGKGFEKVVERVNQEFDEALIRLHIPHSQYCDAGGSLTRAAIEACQALAKPGVRVEVSSNYLTVPSLLDWLAGNAINCFFYDPFPGRGISSVIDFALSARRPIAITQSDMFRHIAQATPSILIEQSSLKEIMSHGIEPLRPFYDRWSDTELAKGYDRAIDYALEQPAKDLTPNRVLTVRDRERLRPAIAELTELSPDIMSRKFPLAVFQNAFIYEQAKTYARPGDKIILIGGYEDPIGPALIKLGFDVTITDPQVDGRESFDVLCDSLRTHTLYDMVISCSVIEHVEDDTSFVQTLYHLLKPNGIALVTTDFRDGWKSGVPKPAPDVRLYTLERLRLLASSLPEGCLLDKACWKAIAPYFHYDGADYGFCSFAFRRPANDLHSQPAFDLVADEYQRKKARIAATESELAKMQLKVAALTQLVQELTPPVRQPVTAQLKSTAKEVLVSMKGFRKKVSKQWKSQRRKWQQNRAA